MAMKLTSIDELRKALRESGGNPVEVEDDQTSTVYVMVTREEFQRKYQPAYDDSELSPEEMLAAASSGLDDVEGWGAPGMEDYGMEDYDQTNRGSAS